MKIANCWWVTLALACYIFACSTPKRIEQEKPAPVGDYQYTGYDKKGSKAVEGRLSITSVESKRIRSEEVTQLKGNWELKKVGTQEHIGAQEGSGELIGSIDKGELDINLNPDVSDGNVYLHGTIEGRRFHGTWSAKGYAGVISEGTFEAIRK
jgi:hypothetical protein